MKIKVHDLLSDKEQEFTGPDAQVRRQLLANWPHLHRFPQASTVDLVEVLDHSQYRAACVVPELAKREATDPHAAAQILAGKPADPDRIRAALWEADGDHFAGALLAHGIEPTSDNRQAIQSWMGLSHLSQSAPEPLDPLAVEPVFEEDKDVAEQVSRAFQARGVRPSTMRGQHSAGALVADVPGEGAWYLKPDSAPSPAAGSRDDESSEPRRECAFRAAATIFGLDSWIPETALLRVGDKEMAAIQMAPRRFEKLSDILAEDPNFGLRLFRQHLDLVHRWGAMYYILGETDGGAGNVLAIPDGDDVLLIDHGSAFAGAGFSPATDRSTFVPYFLRFYGHGPFNTAPITNKFRRMPRLDGASAQQLRAWLQGLDEQAIAAAVARFGVDPSPSLQRLDQLQQLATKFPADLAINTVWIDPAPEM